MQVEKGGYKTYIYIYYNFVMCIILRAIAELYLSRLQAPDLGNTKLIKRSRGSRGSSKEVKKDIEYCQACRYTDRQAGLCMYIFPLTKRPGKPSRLDIIL